jgi:alpha-glucosidase
MNYYGFALPVWQWLAGTNFRRHPAAIETADVAAWLDSARGRIPPENQLAQLNLLDSHDTARLLTVLGGDAAAMKLAVTLLFTWPGVPCVYYGDEIGLEGGDDPDCRRCFDWDRARWNLDLFAHYRDWIALRRGREELRRGACLVLATAGDVLAFARFTAGAATVVAVNRGADPAALRLPLWQLPLEGARWRAAGRSGLELELDGGCLDAEVPARGQLVLHGEA